MKPPGYVERDIFKESVKRIIIVFLVEFKVVKSTKYFFKYFKSHAMEFWSASKYSLLYEMYVNAKKTTTPQTKQN